MVLEFEMNVPLVFQRYPTDKAYFIAKEILTTERTYLKDLEVITVVSRPLGLQFSLKY